MEGDWTYILRRQPDGSGFVSVDHPTLTLSAASQTSRFPVGDALNSSKLCWDLGDIDQNTNVFSEEH